MLTIYDSNTTCNFAGFVGNKKLTFRAKGAWIVRSFPGCFNPPHTHPDSDFSCAGFLKTPDWEEEHKIDEKNDDVEGGNLEFIYGNPNGFIDTSYRIRPEVGDIYFFPANLLHTVYPFRTNGERRSFSVNFKLDTD